MKLVTTVYNQKVITLTHNVLDYLFKISHYAFKQYPTKVTNKNGQNQLKQ